MEIKTLLQAARQAVRRTTETFDAEIAALIHSALADLGRRGIAVDRAITDRADISEIPPLVLRAVILYVKANFGLDGDIEQQRRFEENYEALTIGMSMQHTAEEGAANE